MTSSGNRPFLSRKIYVMLLSGLFMLSPDGVGAVPTAEPLGAVEKSYANHY